MGLAKGDVKKKHPRMMFDFPCTRKTFHSQRIFKIWIVIFFMAYLSNFSLDQCRETILFLCVKKPRLLGNVSEGKEFQKTVSLSLSESRSEPRIWIHEFGLDVIWMQLFSPPLFLPRWQACGPKSTIQFPYVENAWPYPCPIIFSWCHRCNVDR